MQSNSPLELLHQFFVKLGARYVVVTDADGLCEQCFCVMTSCIDCIWIVTDEGVIDKKTWLAFLSELEEKS
jgi:chloride channel 3/4/5